MGQPNYGHTDHLNTPRLIADDQQRTVWRWDNTDPFGGNPPDENPSGLGTFEFPLRFPGQYFDKETGLHYSYLRDCYDPGTGRFCEPDPAGTVMFGDMGLKSLGPVGRMQERTLGPLLYSEQPKHNHLYVYALKSPLRYTDPTGLLSTSEICLRDVWCTLVVPQDNFGVCIYWCDDGTFRQILSHGWC